MGFGGVCEIVDGIASKLMETGVTKAGVVYSARFLNWVKDGNGEGGVAEHSVIFRDIAMVFGAALVCGLLAWRIKQPILLGYVMAGLIVSPLTPGFRVHDTHVFELMAEVGVVLLMFSVGIHFSIPDLLKVKWVALLGSPLGVVLSVA